MSSPVSMAMNLIRSVLPDWPEWAMNLLITMSTLLVITYFFTSFVTPEEEKSEENKTSDKSDKKSDKVNGKSNADLRKEFDSFRRKYIIVYLVIMLADWMQGTHMYTLYLSYNVNISALFLTGFLSGALFAPFLGSAVDKFGRKRSCIVYCVLEIIINILEHFDDFPTLILGRVLGGISTNLLFSAFESWMTTEHRKKGFPESWLQKTYSEASIGNGTMAVLAGIVAQVLEDNLGHIGPFQGAVALTVVALLLILGWEENYGQKDEGDEGELSLYNQFTEGWKATLNDSKIWKIGLTQALSEGAMYTFVFMWVPTLLSMDPPGGLPTGCVFSSLMIAITMGGMLFPVMQSYFAKFVPKQNVSEVTASVIYIMASISMAVPALCISATVETGYCFKNILISFVVVECCVGLFNPVAGTLRSKYVPDALQGGILNIFRLPLNAIVVSGTFATDYLPSYQVFAMISVCFMAAAFIQLSLASNTSVTATSSKKKKE